MEVVVETFRNPGEPSSRGIRVRPIPGQRFSPQYRVWCSVSQRREKPVGSMFLVNVSLVHSKTDSYLKIDLKEQWVPVSEDEAQKFVRAARE